MWVIVCLKEAFLRIGYGSGEDTSMVYLLGSGRYSQIEKAREMVEKSFVDDILHVD